VPGSGTFSHPIYLDTPDVLAKFTESIRSTPDLAVDTEGASFHRYVDRVYLLQLSTATRHAIVDPLKVVPSAALGALLEDRAVQIVFHDADYDLRLLHQDYGWRVTNIFDTRVAAQLLGLKSFGLAALLESNFGVKLDKKHQRADWSMRPLTRDMLDYAAQDTAHLLALRDRLRDALVSKGRWAWAQEEFERLEGTRWEPDDPGTAFLRLKGARDLTRRELAVLRELVAWRDAVAREQDRSTFRVAGNEVLFDLARRTPNDQAALKATKGLSRSVIDRQSGAILDAIARGRAVPESDLPRFPKAPRWDRDPEYENRVARLKSVRDRVAAELELDPGVLCPRDRLETIARRRPDSLEALADVPDLRRWQSSLLGERFIQALEGDGGKAVTRTGAAASNGDEESPYRDT
jgi:ribonuclease D